MKKKELVKRYIFLIVGLFFSALAVAVTKHGELGVSPVSSVANILSLKFTFLSMGTWLIIWNCVLIVGQILILGKKFNLIQLLQIPVSFLFGYFTDFGTFLVSFIPAENYFVRLAFCVCGVVILGFGISLTVAANVVMNSGEAFVKAISDQSGKNFGNVKVFFDVGCVLLSVILSLIFFSGFIEGTREGTVISALCTGLAVKFFTARVKKPLERYFCR